MNLWYTFWDTRDLDHPESSPLAAPLVDGCKITFVFLLLLLLFLLSLLFYLFFAFFPFFSLFLWIPGLTLMSCSFFITNSKLHLLLSGMHRSSHPEVFLKMCSKFTGEHPCRSVISIKLRRPGCSVNLLHVSRTLFLRSTSGWLLLYVACNDSVILRDRL